MGLGSLALNYYPHKEKWKRESETGVSGFSLESEQQVSSKPKEEKGARSTMTNEEHLVNEVTKVGGAES